MTDVMYWLRGAPLMMAAGIFVTLGAGGCLFLLHAHLAVDDGPQIVLSGMETAATGIPGAVAVHLKLDGADVPPNPYDVRLASGGRLLHNECPSASEPCFVVGDAPGGVSVDGVAVNYGLLLGTAIIPTGDGQACVAGYGLAKCSEYDTAGRPTAASGFGQDMLWLGLIVAVELAFGILAYFQSAYGRWIPVGRSAG